MLAKHLEIVNKGDEKMHTSALPGFCKFYGKYLANPSAKRNKSKNEH